MTELDPDDPSVGFGLADLGFGCPELGRFSVDELQAFEGPFGLGIERDAWCRAGGQEPHRRMCCDPGRQPEQRERPEPPTRDPPSLFHGVAMHWARR